MSAQRLRAAAAAMRARAEAASAAPWDATGMWWYPVMEINDEGRAVDRPHGFHAVTDAHGSGMVAHSALDADAEHIASWHPAVALAVADWLDTFADHWFEGAELTPLYAEALTLADAYLGEAL